MRFPDQHEAAYGGVSHRCHWAANRDARILPEWDRPPDAAPDNGVAGIVFSSLHLDL